MEKLTNKDHRIMALLIDNPRATLTQISRDLGMPISTVYERIKRIEDRYEFTGAFVRKDKDKGDEGEDITDAIATELIKKGYMLSGDNETETGITILYFKTRAGQKVSVTFEVTQ